MLYIKLNYCTKSKSLFLLSANMSVTSWTRMTANQARINAAVGTETVKKPSLRESKCRISQCVELLTTKIICNIKIKSELEDDTKTN